MDERRKEYREKNKEKIAEQNKKWREKNKEKVAEKAKKYREKNKEKIADRHKKYREKNKEKIVDRHKKYREKNKEKIAEQNKKWREKNKEKIVDRHKKYREKNKEKIAEQNKKWREKNKEKIAEKDKKYREKNKEKVAEKAKKYREKNKEKIAEQQKKYYEKNKEQLKKYYEKNKEQLKKYYEKNKNSIGQRLKEYREKNIEKMREREKRKSKCTLCKFITGRYRFIPKENKKIRLCADCFYHTYPDEKKVPSKYKRKQHYIHEKLKKNYGKDFFIYDQRIECGCSRKIPDWFCDCFHFALNLECDEDQHKRNDTSCENKRLMELFLDCANRPFVCLRFNPDKYINNKGEKVEGCFSFDTKNTLIVNQQEFERRWNILEERIDHFLEHGPEKEVELEKLFYDDFD